MKVRSTVQIMAGVVAAAALVGVPTWAAASQTDETAGSTSDRAGMMSSPASRDQTMSSMMKMMDDSDMRMQMHSRMSSDMAAEMAKHGKFDLGQMRDMGRGSMSGRSAHH